MFRHSVPILLGCAFLTLLASAQPLDRPLDQLDSLGNPVTPAKASYAMVELQAIQTGDQVPFWMRSLQHGSVPFNGTSVSAIATFMREYGSSNPKKLDWGGGFQLRTNIGGADPTILTEDENKALRAQAIVTEAYLKVKSGKFEFKAGRFRQVQGLSDTALGIGNFSQAGNSLPVPMIQIGLPDYTFPIFDSLLSFKGTFSQGWMGETRTNLMNKPDSFPQFLHQKSLHMRIGKPRSRLKGVIGLVHEVFWVNNRKLYGENVWELSPLETYLYIVTAKRYIYEPGSSETTTVGNNLGHIDLGLDITGNKSDIRLYRQIIYESLRTLSDGITGVSIVNRMPATGKLSLRRLVLEYMSTMNQGYDNDGTERYDNYYNHEFLYEGVAYKGAGFGNPFISPKSTVRNELPSTNPQRISFSNTRLKALHAGVDWSAGKILVRNRLSYSRNYGMYSTRNTFPPSDQFSMSMEAAVPLKGGWQARALFAFDSGSLLYNSAGGFLSIARIF